MEGRWRKNPDADTYPLALQVSEWGWGNIIRRDILVLRKDQYELALTRLAARNGFLLARAALSSIFCSFNCNRDLIDFPV